MSDFDVTSFVSTPKKDVLSILILQRRNELIDQINEVYSNELRKHRSKIAISNLKGSILSLIIEVYVMFDEWLRSNQGKKAVKNRGLSINTAEKFIKLIEKKNKCEDILPLYLLIEGMLYAKKIIRVDTRPKIDKTRWENSNKAAGLD